MGWLWAIIVGFVLGLIAKAVLPGKQHLPLWLATVCGMGGAALGNWLARGLGVAATPGIDWWRHLFQIVVAIILVYLADRAWMAMKGRKQKA
jgi:uncharacterized membrane protein YeaQ/YmgE (transglycosylase-associated protein family)